MEGIKDLRLLQIGAEKKNDGEAGTAVACTEIWRGESSIKDLTPVGFIPEQVQNLIGVDRSKIMYYLGGLTMAATPLTAEQLPWILRAAIRAVEAGVKDGAGSGYAYDYTVPMTPATIQKTAATIAFVSATKKITDSGNGLAWVKTGDLIKVSGAGQAGNNDYFLVATGGVAGEIVVTEALTDESVGATVTIELVRQTYTFRGGDNSAADKGAYGYCKSFTIEGKGAGDSDAITMAAEWEVRQWIADAFTASLSVPAVAEFSFPESQLFIDAVDGTLGATDFGVFTDFSLKYNTGIKKRYGANNSKNYDSADLRGGPEMVLDVGMPWAAKAQAEVAAFRAQTPRKIRLVMNGAALTSGNTYTKKLVRVDLPGKWESFSGLEDVEGGDVVRGTFRCKYNSTAALNPTILVVNEKSTYVV
jgi:hypothetical protein